MIRPMIGGQPANFDQPIGIGWIIGTRRARCRRRGEHGRERHVRGVGELNEPARTRARVPRGGEVVTVRARLRDGVVGRFDVRECLVHRAQATVIVHGAITS
jgi:hypothetical protein